ncbi:MAG: 2,3-dimethylmalate dehydratase large subunit [Deltaproteobacteria bacterium ADurb.BinA179]|nr:3-isopropylmalate dehydratase large subunit [Deltaproteobacteria bacterium]MDI9541497.1 3-isopropylmalate dehydratase large subunit [Pseudomonadota bacterium]NLW68753.1 3-isopropylmalate dehydratase large subunit [Bacteriovoracaceae bacterium]OPZ28063.1 MAG: 2,3-dimethylmalate dehydratase large subunit [Deltaproteobacteria bacterium ADurb.BinA179]HRR20525.1 3-isopropylmalate dehydratase large subunit [Desulfomonilia bacterium]
MGMTIAEKILAAHTDAREVTPGDIVKVNVDVALANDITAPLAIKAFESGKQAKPADPDKIVFVLDHFTPNKDIASANQCKMVRDFARRHELEHFFDAGEVGVEHALLPEKGLVLPGDLIIGADSHTCTYGALGAFATGVGSTDLAGAMLTAQAWMKVPESMKFVFKGELLPWVGGKDLILYLIGDIGVDGGLYRVLEIEGPAIDSLDVSGRLTISNMAIEAGAKAGIIRADAKTEAYVKPRARRPYTIYTSDEDARYVSIREYDCSNIEPQVAFPHLPENTRPISEVGEVRIDQVFIGSCTNGRIEDLRVSAEILKGRKVDRGVRCIVMPATPDVFRQAEAEGLIRIFLESGAIIGPPSCGPCLGGHLGILAKGEKALATTNRNFVGRMGDPASEVYLSGPAVAAASAIAGKISSPSEVM